MKSNVRQEKLAWRRRLHPDVCQRWSTKVCETLSELLKPKSIQTIFAYAPTQNEVDITPLIQEFLLSNEKKICMPKVIDKKTIAFYRIGDWTEMKPGFQGILEPSWQEESEERHDLVLVPGVAFNEQKYRIGYGGGYYDRFLQKKNEENEQNGKEGQKVGLFYHGQMAAFEADGWDIALDSIITERGML